MRRSACAPLRRLVEFYRAEVDKFTAISQRDAASALGIRAMIAAGDEEE